MNRREAIAALMSLPSVASIRVANIRPGDVIVAEYDQRLTLEQKAQVRMQLQQVWPDRKIVVCDGGMQIKVMREP